VAPNKSSVVHTSNGSEDGHENPNGSISAVKHAKTRPLSPYPNVWFWLLFSQPDLNVHYDHDLFFLSTSNWSSFSIEFQIAEVYAYGSLIAFIMLLNSAKNFRFPSICPASHANSMKGLWNNPLSDCLWCHTILQFRGCHSNDPGWFVLSLVCF
jgi:hypothetical protein